MTRAYLLYGGATIVGVIWGTGTPFTPMPRDATAQELALPSVSDLVERISPSVVTLTAASGSVGSGIVVRPDGLALTCKHLVQQKSLSVTISDGTTVPATIVVEHATADLAIVRVQATKPLLAVIRGDSRRLRVGDWVVAIGNPFGLGPTASLGIVGGLGRALGAGTADLIQTDAAINPGNSGGPVVNMRGEVVGVASAAITLGQGLGFAVPIHLAEPLLHGR
jgi:serine protease Do